MLVEIICIASVIGFLFLLIKERDIRYVLGFIIGFLAAFWIEPMGVAENSWAWASMIKPFDYLLFGVPICIYLIYASIGAMIVFATKYFIELRKKYKDGLDRTAAYVSIIAGFVLVLLSVVGVHPYIGLLFIMFGLFLLVKEPVMFYIGAVGLAADFIIEHLFIFTGQIAYPKGYGTVGVAFFLGGAILSGLFILIGRYMNKLKKKE